MVVVSYSGKEINGKLVYYGPGLSGKTTNLEYIYQSVPSNNRGKMVSMKTRTERTLFFDFLPVDLGEMGGFKTRFLLYTVPGQVYYNATRKLVLRGVDAVIFVADSARGKMDENIESLQNLKDNLKEYGLNVDEIPWVIQYNKRDIDDVYSIEELEKVLNPTGVPYFEAVATTGVGVFETFRGIAKLLLQKLSKEIKLGEVKGTDVKTAPAAAPPAAKEVAAPAEPAAANAQETPYRPGRPQELAERTPSAAAPVEAPKETPPPAPEPAPEEAPAMASEAPESAPESPPDYAVAEELEPVVAASEERAAPEPVEQVQAEELEPVVPVAEEPEPVAAVSEQSEPRKLEPVLPDRAELEAQAAEENRGFWGRMFGGRNKKQPDSMPEQPRHAHVSEVKIPAVAGSGETSPVFIEKRVQVPITLGPEEIVRGATLRLVLEIQVEASEDKDESGDHKSRAA